MDTNQKENDFIIQNGKLSPAALKRKTELENNPASRTDHMAYLPDMEQISSDIRDKVLAAMNAYEPDKYTARDVLAALSHDRCSIEDFKALLSPAAEPFLEKMAQRAERETRNHFGNSTYIFTPLYIANYCENYCVYCGFNCYNDIHRKQLSMEEIEHEMKVIADSGIEEILMLTGESKSKSSITYIADGLPHLHHARVDEANHHHGGSGGGLDDGGNGGAQQHALQRRTRQLIEHQLQLAAGHLFQIVAHDGHAV